MSDTSTQPTLTDLLLERDQYRTALLIIQGEHTCPGIGGAKCAVCENIDKVLPLPPGQMHWPPYLGGVLLEPHPCAGERWEDRVVITPNDLMPFDRLTDGRYVEAVHGSMGGRRTQMTVGHVRPVAKAVELSGGIQTCVWDLQWGPTDTIPIPPQLEVFRSDQLAGYTCTAPGNPDECLACPARAAQ